MDFMSSPRSVEQNTLVAEDTQRSLQNSIPYMAACCLRRKHSNTLENRKIPKLNFRVLILQLPSSLPAAASAGWHRSKQHLARTSLGVDPQSQSSWRCYSGPKSSASVRVFNVGVYFIFFLTHFYSFLFISFFLRLAPASFSDSPCPCEAAGAAESHCASQS